MAILEELTVRLMGETAKYVEAFQAASMYTRVFVNVCTEAVAIAEQSGKALEAMAILASQVRVTVAEGPKDRHKKNTVAADARAAQKDKEDGELAAKRIGVAQRAKEEERAASLAQKEIMRTGIVRQEDAKGWQQAQRDAQAKQIADLASAQKTAQKDSETGRLAANKIEQEQKGKELRRELGGQKQLAKDLERNADAKGSAEKKAAVEAAAANLKAKYAGGDAEYKAREAQKEKEMKLDREAVDWNSKQKDRETKTAAQAAKKGGKEQEKFLNNVDKFNEDSKKKKQADANNELKFNYNQDQKKARAAEQLLNADLRFNYRQDQEKARSAQTSLDGQTRYMTRQMEDQQKYKQRLADNSAKLATKQADEAEKAAKKEEDTRAGTNRRIAADMKQMAAAVAEQAKKGAQMMAGAMAAMSAPILIFAKKSIDAFGEFDQGIKESQAIMKIEGDQNERMVQTALEIGTKGKFGPKELAHAFYFLASAGLSTEQSIKGIGTVATFAQAGVMSMEEATSMLTNSTHALGLNSKNAAVHQSELQRVSDVLNLANIKADATTKQFAEALAADAAPTLRAYNKTVEEGTAVLAAYAQQGIKGKLAGGHLARAMRFMAKTAIKNSGEQRRLGLEVFDANGEFKNMADIIENLELIMGGMSDKSRAAMLLMMGFETRTQRAILPLIGMSKQIRQWQGDFEKAGGTSADIAGKQMESFENQMKRMKNTVDAVKIGIGEQLAPAVLIVADAVRAIMNGWREMPAGVRTVAVFAAVATAAMLGFTAAVIAAGLAMTYLTGGLNIIVAGIVVMLTAWFATVAAAVGSIAGFWVTMQGGIAGLRQKLEALWQWLMPVREALADMFSALWDLAKEGYAAVYDAAVKAWDAMGGKDIDWTKVLATVTRTIYFWEFSLRSFGLMAKYTWAGFMYGTAQAGSYLIHFFTSMIPDAARWFYGKTVGSVQLLGTAFVRIFGWVYDTIVNFFDDIWTNVKNIFKNVWAVISNVKDLITGKVKFEDIIVPIKFGGVGGKGLGPVMEQLKKDFEDKNQQTKFQLTPRIEQKGEKKWREEFESLGKSVNMGFEEFMAKKLQAKEVLPKEDELKTASEKKGKEIGADVKKGMGKELEKFDAALFRSAEALARYVSFSDRIRDPSMFRKEHLDQPVRRFDAEDPNRGAGANKRQDQHLEMLRRIAQATEEQNKKNNAKANIEIDEADFDD